MDSITNIDHLRREIAQRESELADLRSQLAVAESEQRQQRAAREKESWRWPLQEEDYQRYSRQMIVPNFGLQAQLRLTKAKVLLVGAGGLGCPAAAYLAGAGVGTLGLVDGDEVEVSNLHRQVAHSTARVGISKVQSAVTYLKGLNPTVTYQAHQTHLTTDNAEDIVSLYDLVLDCTDHPTSRYLVSDICVLLGKPLVSASAFQTSGQLITLNNPPGKGPCYRCIFPKPPPPDSIVGCGEGGILGPVVGVMGVLQALEAIKVLTSEQLESEKDATSPSPTMMLLFSGEGDTPFRSVRMRGKRKACFACGDEAGLTLAEIKSSMDYIQFCGVRQPVSLLKDSERISAEEFNKVMQDTKHSILLDVREREHFDLCNIPGSINIPISRFTSHRQTENHVVPDWMPPVPSDCPIYLVCRVGNDSQIAVQKLKGMGLDQEGQRLIGDIKGGLAAWKAQVDPTLPFI